MNPIGSFNQAAATGEVVGIPLPLEAGSSIPSITKEDHLIFQKNFHFIQANIKIIKRLYNAFEAHCKSRNYTHFDFNKLTLFSLKGFAELILIHEILSYARSQTFIDEFDKEKITEILFFCFDVANQTSETFYSNFCALSKHYFHKDRLGANYYLASIHIYLSRMQGKEGSKKTDSMTIEQLRQLTTKSFDEAYAFSQNDTYHLGKEAIKDHDQYAQWAAKISLDILNWLTELTEEKTISISKKCREVQKLKGGVALSNLNTTDYYLTCFIPRQVEADLSRMIAHVNVTKSNLSFFQSQNLSQILSHLPKHFAHMKSIDSPRLHKMPLYGAFLCFLITNKWNSAIALPFFKTSVFPFLLKNYKQGFLAPLNEIFCRWLEIEYPENKSISKKNLKKTRDKLLACAYVAFLRINHKNRNIKDLITQLSSSKKDTDFNELYDVLQILEKQPLPLAFSTEIEKLADNFLKKLRLDLIQLINFDNDSKLNSLLEHVFTLDNCICYFLPIFTLASIPKKKDPYLEALITFVRDRSLPLNSTSLNQAIADFQKELFQRPDNYIPYLEEAKQQQVEISVITQLSTPPIFAEGSLFLESSLLLESIHLLLRDYLISFGSAMRYFTSLLFFGGLLEDRIISSAVDEAANFSISSLRVPITLVESEINQLMMEELIAEEAEKIEKTLKSPTLPSSVSVINTPPLVDSLEEETLSTLEPPATEALDLSLTNTFPGLEIISIKSLLGKKKLEFSHICRIQYQIYLHHALTLLAFLRQKPQYTKAFTFSLVEVLHLSIEQLMTAIGVDKGKVRREDLQGHHLSKLCELLKLPLALKNQILAITEVGTYNSRYPYLNQITTLEDSFVGRILKTFQNNQHLDKLLLEEIAQALNQVIACLTGSPALSSDQVLSSLEHFYSPEKPLPVEGISLTVNAVIFAVEERFPDVSNRKIDLIAHLKEFEAILSMINENKGIDKALCAILLHALYRIAQYTTKNFLLLKLPQDSVNMLPKNTATLLKQFDLSKAEKLRKALAKADMKKGLDYMLGERSIRPLSDRESALLEMHYTSLAPVGFSFQDQKKQETEIVQEISDTAHSIVEMLEGLLNELKE